MGTMFHNQNRVLSKPPSSLGPLLQESRSEVIPAHRKCRQEGKEFQGLAASRIAQQGREIVGQHSGLSSVSKTSKGEGENRHPYVAL